MVRNLHQGPHWFLCTAVEVLGQVTYVVEMEDGQQWKRHVDQFKTWLHYSQFEPVMDSVLQQVAEDLSTEPSADSSETETPSPAEESSTFPDPSSPGGSEMVTPRYPSWNR